MKCFNIEATPNGKSPHPLNDSISNHSQWNHQPQGQSGNEGRRQETTPEIENTNSNSIHAILVLEKKIFFFAKVVITTI